ncbi:unnamed protein product [Boreogadus saida]
MLLCKLTTPASDVALVPLVLVFISPLHHVSERTVIQRVVGLGESILSSQRDRTDERDDEFDHETIEIPGFSTRSIQRKSVIPKRQKTSFPPTIKNSPSALGLRIQEDRRHYCLSCHGESAFQEE